MDWMLAHAPWASGAVGLGGASAYIGKTLADKKQDKRLVKLEKEVRELRHVVELNAQADKHLKEQVDGLLCKSQNSNGVIQEVLTAIALTKGKD